MKNTLVSPTASAAPAGWYNDPLGIPQLRWWNGIGWTNHVQEVRAHNPCRSSRSAPLLPWSKPGSSIPRPPSSRTPAFREAAHRMP
jgi:hypothetical protein